MSRYIPMFVAQVKLPFSALHRSFTDKKSPGLRSVLIGNGLKGEVQRSAIAAESNFKAGTKALLDDVSNGLDTLHRFVTDKWPVGKLPRLVLWLPLKNKRSGSPGLYTFNPLQITNQKLLSAQQHNLRTFDGQRQYVEQMAGSQARVGSTTRTLNGPKPTMIKLFDVSEDALIPVQLPQFATFPMLKGIVPPEPWQVEALFKISADRQALLVKNSHLMRLPVARTLPPVTVKDICPMFTTVSYSTAKSAAVQLLPLEQFLQQFPAFQTPGAQ